MKKRYALRQSLATAYVFSLKWVTVPFKTIRFFDIGIPGKISVRDPNGHIAPRGFFICYTVRVGNESKRIVIVEDEVLLGTLLLQRVERAGFSANLFPDAKAALEFLKKSPADLVLLDIIMPGMSGFEFMETLQKNPEYHKPPVVFISNLGQASDVARGESLGAAGYFVKAKVSMDEIVRNIESFLRG